jgi:hypothetical protein
LIYFKPKKKTKLILHITTVLTLNKKNHGKSQDAKTSKKNPLKLLKRKKKKARQERPKEIKALLAKK